MFISTIYSMNRHTAHACVNIPYMEHLEKVMEHAFSSMRGHKNAADLDKTHTCNELKDRDV